MIKRISFLVVILLVGCSSTKKNSVVEPLFSIIKSNQEQGGTFLFFETITEKNEFSMLANDPDLKNSIASNDISTCNYALINLGAKSDSGYTISISLVAETTDKIVLKITEIKPLTINFEGSNPLFIIKVRSKKSLELQ